MRFIAAVAVIVGTIAFQTAVLSRVTLLGVRPDFLLVVAVTWALVRGPDEGRVVIFVTAFLYGLLVADPAGFPLIAMAPALPLTFLRDSGLIQSKFVMSLLIVGLATLAYEAIYTLLLTLSDGGANVLTTALHVYLPAVLVNLAAAPFVYFLFTQFSWDLRARRY